MLRYKKFKSYDHYVEKQGGKISFKLEAIKESAPKRIRQFEEWFTHANPLLNKGKILCLGARTGCEVVAARNVGFTNSLGIDLHPVGDLVKKDDWHNMSFPDASYENVFTNSIDHCMDLVKLTDEIMRVLKPGGIFYFAVLKKMALSTLGPEWTIEDRMASRAYDAMFWDTEQDIIDKLVSVGFEEVMRWKDDKWFHCCLRKPSEG